LSVSNSPLRLAVQHAVPVHDRQHIFLELIKEFLIIRLVQERRFFRYFIVTELCQDQFTVFGCDWTGSLPFVYMLWIFIINTLDQIIAKELQLVAVCSAHLDSRHI